MIAVLVLLIAYLLGATPIKQRFAFLIGIFVVFPWVSSKGVRVTGEAPSAATRLLAPIVPGKIVAVGLNYRAHAEELEMAVQAEPILFMKPRTAVAKRGRTKGRQSWWNHRASRSPR